jgi:protease PrsW
MGLNKTERKDFHMEDVKKNILNTGIMNILAMIVLFVAAHFLFRGIELDSASFGGTLLTLLFGLIPAFLWVSFYYFLDRKDPEPVIMVIMAFTAGILSKVVFSTFIGQTLFNIGIWNLNSNAMPMVYLYFTEAIIPAISIYIVLRYFFYPSKHFNEPVDGMMYGAFISIGYALAVALDGVFSGGLVTLYYLVFSLLLRLALYSSLGALIGYYFGKARFDEKRSQLFFLVAIIISLGVFCLYAFLSSFFRMNITTSSDFYSIILVLVFAIVMLGIVFFLIQRTLQKGEVKPLEGSSFFIDLVSIITLAVILIAGISIRLIKEGDTTFVSPGQDVSLRIPAEFNYDEIDSNENLLLFSKKLKDERYPLSVKVAIIDDYSPLSFFNLIAMDDNQFKVDDFVVSVNISQEVVTFEENLKKDFKSKQSLGGDLKLPGNRNKSLTSQKKASGQTYLATIYTYSAEKQGLKLEVSIEFPGSDFPEPRDLAKKIIHSFKKEA